MRPSDARRGLPAAFLMAMLHGQTVAKRSLGPPFAVQPTSQISSHAMSSQPSLSWPQGNANETYLALGLEMPIMAIAGSDPELIFLGSSNYLLFMQQNMTTSGNGQLNMSDNLLASSIDPFVGFSEPSGLFSSSKSKPNNMRLLAVLLYADTNGSSSSSSSSSASDSGSSLGLLGLGNSVEEEDDTSSPFNWTTWAADMNTNPGLRMDFDINDFASRAGLGSPIAAEVLIVKSDEEIVDGGSSTSASWTAVSTLFGPKTTADPAGAGTSSSQAVTATANGLSALNAAAAAQATGAAGSGPSGSSASGTSRAGASGAGASGIGASGAAGSSGAGATVSPVLTSASGLGGDDDNACDDDGTGDGTSSDGPSGAGSSSTGSPSAGTGSKSGGSGNSGTGGPGSPNNEAAAASASRRPSGSGASPSGGSATRTGGGGSGGAGGPASRTTTSSAAGSKPTSLGEALVGILQDDDKSVEIGLDLDHGEYATTITANFLKMRQIQPRTEAGQPEGGWTLTLRSSLVPSYPTAAATTTSASQSSTTATTNTGGDSGTTTLLTTASTSAGTAAATAATTNAGTSGGSRTTGSSSSSAMWRVVGLVCASWLAVLVL